MLNVAPLDAYIYHYGWVRPPKYMQSKKKALDSIHKGDQKADQLYKERESDFDYGIVFGLGAELDALDGQLIFDLRINWGFANIMSRLDNFVSLYDDPGTVKTRAITLMVGYRFNWEL